MMKHPRLLYLSLAVVALPSLLMGCSPSLDDQVYEIFKCGKAATLLGRPADADAALKKGATVFAQIKGPNQSLYMMQMGERFQDDFPLYKYQLSGQLEILRDLYKSKACQALYK